MQNRDITDSGVKTKLKTTTKNKTKKLHAVSTREITVEKIIHTLSIERAPQSKTSISKIFGMLRFQTASRPKPQSASVQIKGKPDRFADRGGGGAGDPNVNVLPIGPVETGTSYPQHRFLLLASQQVLHPQPKKHSLHKCSCCTVSR